MVIEEEIETINQKPLCVDLDGTIISSDCLFESLLILLKSNIFYIVPIIYWLIHGRASLKSEIAKRISFNPTLLPYRKDLIDYIRFEKEIGRKIILATASNELIARSIASHLGIFDQVIASNNINLKGEAKRDALNKEFGEFAYDYIGDSKSDTHIWNSCSAAIVINPDKLNLSENIKNKITRSFSYQTNFFKDLIYELRIYQWVKNFLLVLPLILAHKFADIPSFINIIIAFLCFGLMASSIYLTNDMVDIESDRSHPNKRNRPLASGKLSILIGIILSPVLTLLSFTISYLILPRHFFLILVLYFVITTAYSFKLKRVVIIDIITLSILFTIRIVAGAFAVNVIISPWMLAFSMFFFLSLAIVKRFIELNLIIKSNQTEIKGRGYRAEDIAFIRSLGATSAYISVLVFAFYLNSREVVQLYKHPDLLWLILPLFLYWITRILFLAHRDEIHDDPIIFAVKDKTSYGIALAMLIIIFLSMSL
ncbi:MAG: UbiA family prenyltransferase [Candidatus Kapabacteria bacterium]|nr:UbiA family prenyltransferase [Candidatus Kapabacteria bacterium]